MIRNLEPSDFLPITRVVNDWWGGRNVRDSIPRLFFNHFGSSSFVIEEDHTLLGFLIGFLSPSKPNEAYIHFVGVNPETRRNGTGRLLYERFFELAKANGRDTVRCVTSPVNKLSVAFHLRMGFEMQEFDTKDEGNPYCPDYDGPGKDRILFVKRL